MRCECEDVFSHPRLPPLQLVLRGRAVLDPGPSGGRVRGVAEQLPRFLRNFAEGTDEQAAEQV